jgi:DNA-binding LacI/PurR family transcriptional regulator
MKTPSPLGQQRPVRHTSKTVVPLAQRLATVLRDQLAGNRFKAGDRFPSQNELARTFRTSTVSSREAVAILVQEGLLERRFGSGTYVTGRTPERFVAVVTELDISHPAISPAFLTMMQAVRRSLTSAGLQTRVYIGHTSPFGNDSPSRISSWEFWHDLEAGRIIGLVTVGMEAALGQAAVAGRSIPHIDGASVDGVRFWDDQELVFEGLRVLKRKGCRHVACVAQTKGPKHPSLELFEREVKRYGLVTRPEWTVLAPITHERGDGAAAFRSLWLSRTEKPDGLLVLDDMLYRDMAPTFLVNGIRVPDDLVVVSHANAHDVRPFMPDPVRLVVDMDAVGEAMARNLVYRMKDPGARPEGIPIHITVVDADETRQTRLIFTMEPAVGSGAGRPRPVVRMDGVTVTGRDGRLQQVVVGVG